MGIIAKYPFTPELLDALPEELAELMRGLEATLLEEICSRLNLADKLNEVTVLDIKALRSHGISLNDIKRAIAETTNIGMDKLNKLLDDVATRNQAYYTEVIDAAGVTMPDRLIDAQDVDAIRRQTADQFRNITASLGFLVDNGRRALPPAKAYQWALDSALLQVESGAISYNQAIASAVKQLAESGLKTVEYESGHVDSVDVATRRAVMTGINQLNQKYSDQSMEYLDTDLVETTAHAGARDTGVGYQNHKAWQGKVYRWAKWPRTSEGDYPDFDECCAPGDVQGIGGANCRHTRRAFIEGVSERTYTDEQLAHIDDGLGCEYEGRKYTAYEATQKQRSIERSIRKQKKLRDSYKAAGLTDEARAANIKLRRLNAKYKEFSKAAGLPEQPERLKVLYEDEKYTAQAAEAKAIRGTAKLSNNSLQTSPKNGIIKPLNGGGASSVRKICDLDIEKYQSVSPDITTSEVVLTDERIKHIMARHPGDFEEIEPFFAEAITAPDYILKDTGKTGLVLKRVENEGVRFQMILRIHTSDDNPEYKNSVLSAWKISESRWENYIRNKKVLYKSE